MTRPLSSIRKKRALLGIAMIVASALVLLLFLHVSDSGVSSHNAIRDSVQIDEELVNVDDKLAHVDHADLVKEEEDQNAEKGPAVALKPGDENENGEIERDAQEVKDVGDISSQIEELQSQMEQLRSELKMQQKIAAASGKSFLPVKFRNERSRKRILITGGCGFVGSHLVDKLMSDGHEVIALDNYFTGRKRNVEHWVGHPNFEVVHHDVVNPYFVEVDQIYHLASPASPPHYMYNPVKTIKTNTIGTINMLGLAKRVKARVLLASTSEIYGDPEIHPQPESYWGHVNTIGPRSCYDEGKRVAESLLVAYHKQENISIRIARIFNTFGPRMHMDDGRVVSNFIIQSLQKQPITVYGNGTQTRSFQYVSDLVDGLISLMNSDTSLPVNIGNPEEHSMNDFATIIKELVGSSSDIVHKPAQQDDPQQRRPDISRAAQVLGWKPKVSMHDGLKWTIEYFKKELLEDERREGTTRHNPKDHVANV